MIRTGQQIENDIYSLLKNSELSAFVNGDLYKFGMRPYKSVKEDIVVKFVTALTDEIQTGVVAINISCWITRYFGSAEIKICFVT